MPKLIFKATLNVEYRTSKVIKKIYRQKILARLQLIELENLRTEADATIKIGLNAKLNSLSEITSEVEDIDL